MRTHRTPENGRRRADRTLRAGGGFVLSGRPASGRSTCRGSRLPSFIEGAGYAESPAVVPGWQVDGLAFGCEFSGCLGPGGNLLRARADAQSWAARRLRVVAPMNDEHKTVAARHVCGIGHQTH